MRILGKIQLRQVLFVAILVLVGAYIYLTSEGFAGSTGAVQTATPCNPGYWCPASSGSNKALPCPGGTYGSSAGLSKPTCTGKCNAGCACAEGSTEPCQAPCPAGYFCVEGTGGSAVPPIICPAGNYCPISSSAPIPCPNGVFCPAGTTGIAAS